MVFKIQLCASYYWILWVVCSSSKHCRTQISKPVAQSKHCKLTKGKDDTGLGRVLHGLVLVTKGQVRSPLLTESSTLLQAVPLISAECFVVQGLSNIGRIRLILCHSVPSSTLEITILTYLTRLLWEKMYRRLWGVQILRRLTGAREVPISRSHC